MDLLSSGTLEGTIFDSRVAIISGEISHESISFIKRYVKKTPKLGRDKRNPNDIHYVGQIQSDGSYAGTWEFESSSKGNLATSGTFTLFELTE